MYMRYINRISDVLVRPSEVLLECTIGCLLTVEELVASCGNSVLPSGALLVVVVVSLVKVVRNDDGVVVKVSTKVWLLVVTVVVAITDGISLDTTDITVVVVVTGVLGDI